MTNNDYKRILDDHIRQIAEMDPTTHSLGSFDPVTKAQLLVMLIECATQLESSIEP